MEQALEKRAIRYPGNRVLLRGGLILALLVPLVDLLGHVGGFDLRPSVLALGCRAVYLFAGLAAGVFLADLWGSPLPRVSWTKAMRWGRLILASAAILGLWLVMDVMDSFRGGLLPIEGTANNAGLGFLCGLITSLIGPQWRASRTYLLVGTFLLTFLGGVSVYLYVKMDSPDGPLGASMCALLVPFFLGMLLMHDITSQSERAEAAG